jgi:hypothetical protein
MNHHHIEDACKQLRLSGLALTLSLRLQEAAANRLAHEEFLELCLQDELNVRKERLLARRTKNADFRHLKTLEEFDWQFNPKIPRKQIYDLAAGQFIGKATDILFLGPPGVGKTHLAQALGYEAIKMNFHVLYRSIFDLVRDFLRDEAFNQQDRMLRKYLKPDVLIIDDMGLKALPKQSGEYTSPGPAAWSSWWKPARTWPIPPGLRWEPILSPPACPISATPSQLIIPHVFTASAYRRGATAEGNRVTSYENLLGTWSDHSK